MSPSVPATGGLNPNPSPSPNPSPHPSRNPNPITLTPTLASHHGGASQLGARLGAGREAGGEISAGEIADLDLARLSWAADDEGRVCRALALAR